MIVLKKNRILFFIVLCVLVGGHSFLLGQEVQPDSINMRAVEFAIKSPRAAVLRSMAFPGWGQMYNQRPWKAAVVFSTEVGLLSAAIWHNTRMHKSFDDSYSSVYVEDYRDFHWDKRSQYYWYLGFAVLISMADAYVDAHLFNFDESTDLTAVPGGLSVGLMPEGGLAVMFSKRF
jgi:hypothetical protein